MIGWVLLGCLGFCWVWGLGASFLFVALGWFLLVLALAARWGFLSFPGRCFFGSFSLEGEGFGATAVLLC